ncbi:MAG: molybdenum cofactor biosynthesis protein MoaE [Candidatus Bathyarchaeia archaeon]
MGSIGLHKKGEINLEKIINEIKKGENFKNVGATVCFIGSVREKGLKKDKVLKLEYEAYYEEAKAKLKEIREDLLKRNGIIDVSIHHVIDSLNVGEEALYVVVAGIHRKDVFPVLEEAVERVKKEIPIWKKEITEKESYWVS